MLSNASMGLMNDRRAGAGLSAVNPQFAQWWASQINPGAVPGRPGIQQMPQMPQMPTAAQMPQRQGQSQLSSSFGLPRGLNPFAVSQGRYGSGLAFPQAAVHALGGQQQSQPQQFDLLQMLGDFYQPTTMGDVQNNANSTVGANFIGSLAPPRKF